MRCQNSLWYLQYLLGLASCQTFLTESFSDGAYTRILGNSFGILGQDAEFDYVIVGGGLAGLTAAKRLVEDNYTVAVIEGGSFYEFDNGNYSQVPYNDIYYSSPDPSTIQPLVDWGIITEPEQNLAGRRIAYTQGKTLGGTSARNYMGYHRPTNQSFHMWSDSVNDTDYLWTNVFPYFQKSCNFTGPDYTKRGPDTDVNYDPAAFTPGAGPLKVSFTNFYHPISRFAKAAFDKLGFKSIAGFNSGHLLGYSDWTITVNPDNGVRSSSETSFLQETIRTSVHIRVYQRTLAKHIMFNSNKTATGVHVSTEGMEYMLSARKEVILAAGAMRSPQLLMVSGVGPQETLQSLNIPVVKDLPGVGAKLQDQTIYVLTYKVNVTTTSQLATNPEYAENAFASFYANQTGPYDAPGGNYIGWEKFPQSIRNTLSNSTVAGLNFYPPDWPDLEILPLGSASIQAPPGENYAQIGLSPATTNSVGNLTITSNDTADNPVVTFNYLGTQYDRDIHIAALKRGREIAAAWGITQGEISPGANVTSDADILTFLQNNIVPAYHASRTCAMGLPSDPMAVADSHGRVYGVQGVRVIDSSAFPILPPGHIQSTTYMLAERMADWIKAGQ